MNTYELRSVTVLPADRQREIADLISTTRPRVLSRYRRNFGADAEDVFNNLCLVKLLDEDVWGQHFQPLSPSDRVHYFLRTAANFAADWGRGLARRPRTCDADSLSLDDGRPSTHARLMRAQGMGAERANQVSLILVNTLKTSGSGAKFASALDAIAADCGLRPLSRLRFISQFCHGGMGARVAARVRRILRDCYGWGNSDIDVYRFRVRARFRELRGLLEGGALWKLALV